MRASQAFYDVAGPILWRYPVIDFDRHALTLIDGIKVKTTKKHRNTLTPLIKNIKTLTVLGKECLAEYESKVIGEAFASVQTVQVYLFGCRSGCRDPPGTTIMDSSDPRPDHGVRCRRGSASLTMSMFTPREAVYNISSALEWAWTGAHLCQQGEAAPETVTLIMDLSNENTTLLGTRYLRQLAGSTKMVQVLLFDRHTTGVLFMQEVTFSLHHLFKFLAACARQDQTFVIYMLDDYRANARRQWLGDINLDAHADGFDPNIEMDRHISLDPKPLLSFRSRKTYIEEYQRGQHHHFTPEEMVMIMELEEEKEVGEPWYFPGD